MEYLGWIKLHRKLLSWEWYSNLNVRVTFLHLLLMANFEDKMWQGTLIKRGSFITSYKNLSKQIGISEMQIRSALKKLILTNEITIKTTNKYTVVSIVSYDLYQTDNKQNNKQQTNKKQTSNKQITTTKESKEIEEVKEINNNIVAKATPPEKINYESFIDYFNGTCSNFPKVLKITQKRKNAISVILKKYTKQQIADALKIANESEFLTGDNNRGWKADFDFLIKENTITKIIEGSYGKNKRNNTKGATGDELRTIIEAHFRD